MIALFMVKISVSSIQVPLKNFNFLFSILHILYIVKQKKSLNYRVSFTYVCRFDKFFL